MIFTISRWGNDLEEQVVWAEQNSEKITKIVIVAVFEMDLYGYEYKDRLLALNKPTFVIVGSIDQKADTLNGFSNVIYWPTYWLTETYYRLCKEDNRAVNENLGLYYNKFQNCNNKFDKLYITMNKAPKFHRALVMDLLYKNDLFKDGYLIYRELSRYEFKYWKQEVLLLDQKDEKNLFNQEIVPYQYTNALFQIVTESHENFFFLTEKTAIPLFFEKPFIVAGSKDYHKNLKTLGFKLYEELFDYSFDEIEDLQDRYTSLIESLKKIPYNFDINLIYDKLRYNKGLALEYASNIKNFPEIWNELALKPNHHLIPDPYWRNHVINSTQTI